MLLYLFYLYVKLNMVIRVFCIEFKIQSHLNKCTKGFIYFKKSDKNKIINTFLIFSVI